MIFVQRCWIEEISQAETTLFSDSGFLPGLLTSFIILVFLSVVPMRSSAEGEEAVSQTAVASEKLKAAEPIKREPPNYPSDAVMYSKEGWVVLSYTIATDGTVIEPMIEDSSGNEKMERAALKAVAGWEYSPALQNGVPVEQSMTKIKLLFRMENIAKGARREFVSKYRKIAKLIEEKKLDQAEPLLTELQYGERQNLYEDAFFWWLRYVYLDALGSVDNEEKKNSLNKAIGYEVDYLPPDVFVSAAQLLYQLEVQTMEIGEAIETYERLRDSKEAKRSKYYKEALAVMATHVQKVRELIAANNILKLNARIGEHDYWLHPLVRRAFSIEDITGTVKLVDIRCNTHTQRYHLSITNTWEVPDDWGNCCLYVKGEPGSTFTFYEFHRKQTATN